MSELPLADLFLQLHERRKKEGAVPKRHAARRHVSDVQISRKPVRRRSLELPHRLLSSGEDKPYYSLTDIANVETAALSKPAVESFTSTAERKRIMVLQVTRLKEELENAKQELKLPQSSRGQPSLYDIVNTGATTSFFGDKPGLSLNNRVEENRSASHSDIQSKTHRRKNQAQAKMAQSVVRSQTGEGNAVHDPSVAYDIKCIRGNSALDVPHSRAGIYQHERVPSSPNSPSIGSPPAQGILKVRGQATSPRSEVFTPTPPPYTAPDLSVQSGYSKNRFTFSSQDLYQGKSNERHIRFQGDLYGGTQTATSSSLRNGILKGRQIAPTSNDKITANGQRLTVNDILPKQEDCKDESNEKSRKGIRKALFGSKGQAPRESEVDLSRKHVEDKSVACAKLSRVLFHSKSPLKDAYGSDGNQGFISTSLVDAEGESKTINETRQGEDNQLKANFLVVKSVRGSSLSSASLSDLQDIHSGNDHERCLRDYRSIPARGSLTSSESHSTTSTSTCHQEETEFKEDIRSLSPTAVTGIPSQQGKMTVATKHSDLIRQIIERDFKPMFTKKMESPEGLKCTSRIEEEIDRKRTLTNNSQDLLPPVITERRETKPKVMRYSVVDDLPDSSLLMIFRFLETRQLCRLSAVCKRWNRLCWSPQLWKNIRLTQMKGDINLALRAIIEKLLSSREEGCFSVNSLALNHSRQLTDHGLALTAQYFPELQRLEIAHCDRVTGKGLGHVLSKCPSLCFIDATGCCKVEGIDCNNSSSVLFGENASFLQLRYLDLSYCESLMDESLQDIASCCGFLEYLYLRRCSLITDAGIHHLALNCGRIRELSLNDCVSITDAGMAKLLPSCGDLRYLSLARCDITNVTMSYIAEYCTKLKYLNVHACRRICDDGVARLCQKSPRIRSLDFGKCEGVTNNGLHFIAVNCPRLRNLNIKGCQSISDFGLRKLAAHCQNLRFLNIQGCEFSCQTITYLRQRCKYCIIEHTKLEFS